MSHVKIICLFMLLICKPLVYYAQETENNIKPKIIVIPGKLNGKNIREYYDSNRNIQIAIAKVNDIFTQKNANIISLEQCFKELDKNDKINEKADVKTRVLETSFADIYIDISIDVINHPERNAKSVTIVLDAYQTGTSNILSNKVVNGPMFQTDDIGKLTLLALDNIADEFLNTLQSKFDDILKNGQSVYVQFNSTKNSKMNFDTEINGSSLSELIDDWIASHALNGVYNTQGVTASQIIYSDVKIPIRNPKNKNTNYTGQNFINDILKYLKSLNIACKREFSTNNKLIITVL